MLTILITALLSFWICSVVIFVYEYRKIAREEFLLQEGEELREINRKN